MKDYGEHLQCYAESEENDIHKVLGRHKYTNTQAFMVALVPILMILVGCAILTWSCLELLCCSPKARHQKTRELLRERELRREEERRRRLAAEQQVSSKHRGRPGKPWAGRKPSKDELNDERVEDDKEETAPMIDDNVV